ncbi:B12-binding domain-containing protein [Marinilabilia salmonicolor]|jgi:methanogenic corrinoid protein MtbC1|uniref:Methanogenic corrinoid protein MtbC1 n=1 Tax=Marinilabilia salmonicolor TaxID=989 RepID=A0A2T0XLY9_9BACT|nr:cobalamin-dependent protein [Marinilabilia salmonicolor]PRY99957.1 methanogenic corrinoid protein MtbC1 [Marinilabilia salmonicolor]RCW38567.1 methanogenic corrinoid protein MtbC1 [Marinilabilia salmonicolor]
MTIDNQQFLDALLHGDRTLASDILKKVHREGYSVEDIYELLIKPALYQAGVLWETGKISVATEHLASAVVEALLNEMYYHILSLNQKKNKVVVSCVENEFHQIGSRMVADIFELNGWNTSFLGANTPTSELIHFIKDKEPHILALSLTLSQNLSLLDKMINSIRKELPDISIIIGGQAFNHGGHDLVDKYEDVRLFENLKSLNSCIINNC